MATALLTLAILVGMLLAILSAWCLIKWLASKSWAGQAMEWTMVVFIIFCLGVIAWLIATAVS